MSKRGRAADEIPLRFEWERVIKALPMPPTVKHVALTLATYGDLDGASIHPGNDVLIADTGTSRATVTRALTYLRDVGLIVSVGTANRRRRIAEEYRLAIPPTVLARVMDRAANQGSQRDLIGTVQGSHRALIESDQGSQRHDQGSHRGRSGLTQSPHQLRDQLKTTRETPVVNVSTDRARPRRVNGSPRR
jgi:hypothetical protein